MKISLNWLGDFVSFSLDPKTLSDRLTMAGLEVEEIHSGGFPFQKIIVGQVESVKIHPKADKLKVCEVFNGSETLRVVCGAPNVSEGQLVPLALSGAVLKGGKTLEAVSIRGVQSDGMICSENELGISDQHEGIMVLDPDRYRIGEPFRSSTNNWDDTVLEIAVTPNRPDWLSHLGIAREVSAVLNQPFVYSEPEILEKGDDTDKMITVRIHDQKACPRYVVRIVQDVCVSSSPEWLRNRLESVGVRSINNVVDITNYVLMETGHPLHAFDYDLLQGKGIEVRTAKRGETFVTLDGKSRILDSEDLLICDREKPIALAGIMGGLNSEIHSETRNILIESAYFDPLTIRRTAKRLGLSTEASQRFGRGTDPENAVRAANRASELLSELADGRTSKGIVDIYPDPIKPWTVKLPKKRVSDILGIDIPSQTMKNLLTRLGLKVDGDDPMIVHVPTFRQDLQQDVDIIEEIVRLYGYENIQPNRTTRVTFQETESFEQIFQETIRDYLASMGLTEVLTSSMVSEKQAAAFCRETPVTLRNPLSPETACLRTSLIPGILDAVKYNLNRKVRKCWFFEIGNIFLPSTDLLPFEFPMAVCVIGGWLHDFLHWEGRDEATSFFHAKGIVERLLSCLHVDADLIVSEKHPALDPSMTLSIVRKEQVLGHVGTLSPDILAEWDFQNPLFVLEFNVNRLFDQVQHRTQYKSIPRFPSVHRDLALVFDENTPVGRIQSAVKDHCGDILKDIEPFDVYRGEQIPPGKKSVAFSLTFYSPDRTLKEEEVDPVFREIIQNLERDFSATLRS
ncbi:MAG TPA: phenylalanine--tRNA ligase subunit beta [bacterium]|nr:phenylalanine--tRNA ligase subunit beta [bacterium]